MSMTPVKILQKLIGAHRNSPASKYRPLNTIAADIMNSRSFRMFNSNTPLSEISDSAEPDTNIGLLNGEWINFKETTLRWV